jgi:hypothetical protein
MTAVSALKSHLTRGSVYRRSDLAQWSNAVDRHVQMLVKNGDLKKLSGGVYYYPKQTAFGAAPPNDEALVRAFLKDDRFFIASLNAYNGLGLGATQLYNEQLVYNSKRDGRYELGGRIFYFIKRPYFPSEVTEEFLLVDLLNNLHLLAEDTTVLLERVAEKAKRLKPQVLQKAVQDFGGLRAKKFFAKLL